VCIEEEAAATAAFTEADASATEAEVDARIADADASCAAVAAEEGEEEGPGAALVRAKRSFIASAARRAEGGVDGAGVARGGFLGGGVVLLVTER